MYKNIYSSGQRVQHGVLHIPGRSTCHVSQYLRGKETHVMSEQCGASGPVSRIHHRFKGDVAGQGVRSRRGPSGARRALYTSLAKHG